MLYEGNPDATNIRERFRYNFEVPAAPLQESSTTTAPPNGVEPTEQAASDAATQAAADVPVPVPDSAMVNGDVQETREAKTEATADAQETSNVTAQPDVDMAGTT